METLHLCCCYKLVAVYTAADNVRAHVVLNPGCAYGTPLPNAYRPDRWEDEAARQPINSASRHSFLVDALNPRVTRAALTVRLTMLYPPRQQELIPIMVRLYVISVLQASIRDLTGKL